MGCNIASEGGEPSGSQVGLPRRAQSRKKIHELCRVEEREKSQPARIRGLSLRKESKQREVQWHQEEFRKKKKAENTAKARKFAGHEGGNSRARKE